MSSAARSFFAPFSRAGSPFGNVISRSPLSSPESVKTPTGDGSSQYAITPGFFTRSPASGCGIPETGDLRPPSGEPGDDRREILRVRGGPPEVDRGVGAPG